MADNHFKIDRGAFFTPRTTAPSNPVNGDVYYDSSYSSFSLYNNGKWINFSSKSDVASAASLSSAEFTNAVTQSSIVRVTGSTVAAVHGMGASSDGKYLVMYNQSTAITTIKNQSLTEATAVNRIITLNGVDLAIAPGQSSLFMYDGTQSRWVLISPSVSVSAAAYQVTATYLAGFTQSLTGDTSDLYVGTNLYTGFTYTGADTAALNIEQFGSHYVAVKFQASATSQISKMVVRLLKNGGPSGNIYFQIRDGDSVSPGSTVLGTSATVSAASLTGSLQNQNFDFTTPVQVIASQYYWLVFTGDATYFTNGSYDDVQWFGTSDGSSNIAKTSSDGSSWSAFQTGYSLAYNLFDQTRLINLSTTINIANGAGVTGTGIPATTTVRRILTGTSVELDKAVTASGTGVSFTFTNPVHITATGDNVQSQLDQLDYNTNLTYPTYYANTESTFNRALSLLTSSGGGILLVTGNFTLTANYIVPVNTVMLGKGPNTTITFGASTTLSVRDKCRIGDLTFSKSATSGTIMSLIGDFVKVQNCVFDQPTTGTSIGIDVNSNGNHIGECRFSGTVYPSTSTGINFPIGYSNNTEENNFYTA